MMTVVLSPRIAKFAQAQVELGHYATLDEAVNRFIEEQLDVEDQTFEELERRCWRQFANRPTHIGKVSSLRWSRKWLRSVGKGDSAN